MSGHPDPDALIPLPAAPGLVYLRRQAEGRVNVSAGRFSYFDGLPEGPNFFDANVLYHFDFVGDRLTIGDFCALARDVRFIMNGANHAMGGISTFPFNIFGGGWEDGFDPATWAEGHRGDTVVGNDVWLGRDVTVLPGVTIGHGAIVATGTMVTRDVRPYAIVGGNPGVELRRRFDDATVERLLDIAWWDWPLERISRTLDAIRGADVARLAAAD